MPTRYFIHKKREWDKLITDVRSGQIVPIVGSEAIELYFQPDFDFNQALKFNPIDENTPLSIWSSPLLDNLTTGFNKNRAVLLYDYLIYKLLAYCVQEDIIANIKPDIDCAKIDFAKAAFIFLLNIDKELMRKAILKEFIRNDIGKLKPKIDSTSLDILTQCPYFKLYVSLTIDDFLELSLENSFYLGKSEYANNIKFAAPNSKQDFDNMNSEETLPRLYHTYGTLYGSPSYFAITEEEIIEFTCTLGSNSKPENLINYVNNKNLLLIGCRYNDWLLGFLLRMLTGSRIYGNQATKLFADRSFTHCQTYLTQDYEIYIDNIDAIEFINKLQRECVPSKGKKIESGGVFISYHSGDGVCVETLKNLLVKRGIPAWFDEDALESGDVITPKIQDSIINSSAFIACISNNNKAEPHKYFMTEWNYVKKVKAEYERSKLIIPLIIDETISAKDAFVLDHFPDIKNKRLNMNKNNEDEVCELDQDENFEDLVSDLRSCVRKYRAKKAIV